MTNYLQYFLSPGMAMGFAAICLVAGATTFLLRARLGATRRRMVFFAVLVSVGGTLLATILREAPHGACLPCLTHWPIDRFLTGKLGTDVTLNIALFTPLGLFATLLWKTPVRVIAAAAVLSLTIEVLQAVTGTGANDLMDVAANTLGATIGAGVATLTMIVRDWWAQRRPPVARLAKLAAATLALAMASAALSIGGANAIQTAADQDLHRLFDNTTVHDYTVHEQEWGPKLHTFWQEHGMPTNDGYNDADQALQRFTWVFYWTTRCVTARWNSAGFSTEQGQGAQCAARLH